MRTYFTVSCLVAALVFAPVISAHAHLRNYLVTRPYWTPPAGAFEIEVYNDFIDKDSGETIYTHQTEVEYGITDRVALGIYSVLEKKGSMQLEYAATKLEARYRLAKYSRLIMDPALYLEYKAGANGRSDEVEIKFILSKDFANDMNLTFNGILEKEREPGSTWEKGFAMGLCKVLGRHITAGVELKAGEGKAYLIPGVYLNVARGTRLNIGTAFGLSEESDDFQLRTIAEFELF